MEAIIKRINFKAELPKDFLSLRTIQKSNGEACSYLEYQHFFTVCNWRGQYFKEYFTIQGKHILFSSSFSKWWLIRLVEKTIDQLFPETYLIIYN